MTANTEAAKSAIREYDTMRAIADNTPDEIKEINADMTSPRTSNLTGLPTAHNPLAGQDRLCELIDLKDLKRRRYVQAAEFLSWFLPAWDALTEDERNLLEVYRYGVYEVTDCPTIYLSSRQIARHRKRALERFGVLLFGKGGWAA